MIFKCFPDMRSKQELIMALHSGKILTFEDPNHYNNKTITSDHLDVGERILCCSKQHKWTAVVMRTADGWRVS
jgi:hypothetical protein